MGAVEVAEAAKGVAPVVMAGVGAGAAVVVVVVEAMRRPAAAVMEAAREGVQQLADDAARDGAQPPRTHDVRDRDRDRQWA